MVAIAIVQYGSYSIVQYGSYSIVQYSIVQYSMVASVLFGVTVILYFLKILSGSRNYSVVAIQYGSYIVWYRIGSQYGIANKLYGSYIVWQLAFDQMRLSQKKCAKHKFCSSERKFSKVISALESLACGLSAICCCCTSYNYSVAFRKPKTCHRKSVVCVHKCNWQIKLAI